MQANVTVLQHTGTLSTCGHVASIKARTRRLFGWHTGKAEEAQEQALLESEQRLIEQKHREVGHM